MSCTSLNAAELIDTWCSWCIAKRTSSLFSPRINKSEVMPSPRSRTEDLASHRGDLNRLRVALLQFLDTQRLDVVKVDDSRSICRVKTVSSKRITQVVLAGVVEATFARKAISGDQMELIGFAKLLLNSAVDTVAWKGNVVPAASPEARRRMRGNSPVRHGSSDVVDAVTLECVDAYWNAVETRKASTAAAAELPADGPPPPAPSSPERAAEPAPAVGEAAAAQAPVLDEIEIVPSNLKLDLVSPRPKSSVSKTEAVRILDAVAGILALRGGQTQAVLDECLSVMRQRWPARN
jgi:hypothetical protein